MTDEIAGIDAKIGRADAPNLSHAEITSVLEGLIRYIEWGPSFCSAAF